MTTTFLPEIARNSLRPLETEVELEAAPSTPIKLRKLADVHRTIVRLIADLWGKELASLEEGVWGHVFLQSVDKFLDALEVAQTLGVRIRQLAGEQKETARDLATTEGEIEQLRTQMSEWQARLSRPPSAAFLEAARNAMDRPNKQYISSDDFLASLRNADDV